MFLPPHLQSLMIVKRITDEIKQEHINIFQSDVSIYKNNLLFLNVRTNKGWYGSNL